MSFRHGRWQHRPLHGQTLPLLLSTRRDTFAATTMPGETLPMPALDVTKIKTQPLPAVSGNRKRRGYPKQMFWWSLIFILAGYIALLWAQNVISLIICEWIGLGCISLWLIDMLIFSLFFRG